MIETKNLTFDHHFKYWIKILIGSGQTCALSHLIKGQKPVFLPSKLRPYKQRKDRPVLIPPLESPSQKGYT